MDVWINERHTFVNLTWKEKKKNCIEVKWISKNANNIVNIDILIILSFTGNYRKRGVFLNIDKAWSYAI